MGEDEREYSSDIAGGTGGREREAGGTRSAGGSLENGGKWEEEENGTVK